MSVLISLLASNSKMLICKQIVENPISFIFYVFTVSLCCLSFLFLIDWLSFCTSALFMDSFSLFLYEIDNDLLYLNAKPTFY